MSKFVWYELMASDPVAAARFYGDVIGWGAQAFGADYTQMLAGGQAVAGIMPMPDKAKSMGVRPAWVGYLGVRDINAALDELRAAGGAIYRPAYHVPSIGWMAVVADPQGAMFMLIAPEGAGELPNLIDPGHIGWHELYANDRDAAFEFYSGLYGWTKAGAVDLGADGIYQLFATGAHPVGGMMNKPAHFPAPHWLYYFNVDAVVQALVRAVAGGGKMLNGPEEVPDGSIIAQALDPQGAVFALVERKK